MTWQMSMWVLLAVLISVILSPIVIGILRGRVAVCGAATHFVCFREWISGLAGPLAILAAILAAWPVWEQLEESRTATRLTLASVRLASASVVSLQEANLNGIMGTFSEEDRDVKDSLKIVYRINILVETIQSEIKEKPNSSSQTFQQLKRECVEMISVAQNISQEMEGKKDKDSVVPSRKDVEYQFQNLATQLRKIQGFTQVDSENSAAAAELGVLNTDVDNVIRSAQEHQRQTNDIITTNRIKLDELVAKRQKISDSATAELP